MPRAFKYVVRDLESPISLDVNVGAVFRGAIVHLTFSLTNVGTIATIAKDDIKHITRLTSEIVVDFEFLTIFHGDGVSGLTIFTHYQITTVVAIVVVTGKYASDFGLKREIRGC